MEKLNGNDVQISKLAWSIPTAILWFQTVVAMLSKKISDSSFSNSGEDILAFFGLVADVLSSSGCRLRMTDFNFFEAGELITFLLSSSEIRLVDIFSTLGESVIFLLFSSDKSFCINETTSPSGGG